MEPSVERAFALLGLATTCRASELRRRYSALARQWHPDRHPEPPELRKEATARMAEINAAYRVARRYLRRVRATGTSEGRPTEEPTAVRSAEGTFLGLWESWRRAPWMRPSAVSERLAATTGKALVTAALVASVGEIARRALPTEWDLYVMLATVIGVAAGTVVVFRRGRE